MNGYIVVSETLSNGRRWYVSKIPGVGWSKAISKARVFPDRQAAERWAEMEQRTIDRGIGGQRVSVHAIT